MSTTRWPGPLCQLIDSWDSGIGVLARVDASIPGVASGRRAPGGAASTFAPATTDTIPGLLYPLAVRATADHHTGARAFGSARKGGRRHAGIDLYAPEGTAVRAMADGSVLRVAAFYCETWEIEIDHGSFIARYGEVDSDSRTILVGVGDSVKRGDPIAQVGRLVGISVPSNMLHLEMYRSTDQSPLTVRTNPPYQRRKDLMDPTASIDCAVFE